MAAWTSFRARAPEGTSFTHCKTPACHGIVWANECTGGAEGYGCGYYCGRTHLPGCAGAGHAGAGPCLGCSVLTKASAAPPGTNA